MFVHSTLYDYCLGGVYKSIISLDLAGVIKAPSISNSLYCSNCSFLCPQATDRAIILPLLYMCSMG